MAKCAMCENEATHIAVSLTAGSTASVCKSCYDELYPDGPARIDEAHIKDVWIAKTWSRSKFDEAWEALSDEEKEIVIRKTEQERGLE